VVSVIPVLSWLAALIATAIAVARGPRPIAWRFVADRLLRYLMLFPVGFMGLWAALGHLAFPAESAQSIGWATSPFQSEVGSANLGIGLAGIYAAFRSFEARLPTALVVAAFEGGAGIVHVHDIVRAGNFAPGNAGPILFTDFVTPIVVLSLLAATRRGP
jgi:Na+/melibiose symporter-like transporter